MQTSELTPRIVFEDETILVLNKPAGVVVDRAATVKEKTIQEWLEERFKVHPSSTARPRPSRGEAGESRRSRENSKFKDFYRRAGIVHRLDKETSGLLLVAKTIGSFENLQRQFKERRVIKRYLALVHGRVEPKKGMIQASIGRSPFNGKKFGVFLGGREAETRYKVIAVRGEGGNWEVSRGWEVWMRKNFPPPLTLTSRPASHFLFPLLTLLELTPTTGRTHQIRVHLKHLGYPIVSDQKYAGRKTARRDRQWCSRQFLHASHLAFIHPETRKKVGFNIALPRELEKVLSVLQ